jgi:hypothetical protein
MPGSEVLATHEPPPIQAAGEARPLPIGMINDAYPRSIADEAAACIAGAGYAVVPFDRPGRPRP